jgi:hypothetical protein
MDRKSIGIAEKVAIAALTVSSLAGTAWAGPPPPPVIATTVPHVPVGGPMVSTATALVIAGYGIWKLRK